MKATELRIGNYLNITGEPCPIGLGVIESLNAQENKLELHWGYKTKFEPIPLNEEWLVKLGFIKNSNIGETAWEGPRRTGLYHFRGIITAVNKHFIVQLAFPGNHGSYYYPHGESFGGCRYVHQLQNLYFALTGEELTIKK